MPRIEALLSARLFLSPQLAGNRIFFISNLARHLSLYVMDEGGSVPQPLLPPHIALQNPELLGGYPFYVLPQLGKILVMIDNDGDENYQPMLIPIDGGFPEPAFGDRFTGYQVFCTYCDPARNLAYLVAQSRRERLTEAFRANLATGELEKLSQSTWGIWIDGGQRGSHTGDTD
ncbi:MAG: hypothetical protein KatS3mg057_1135 [Herpetosiphonaceae bacterium]|nr:MAG: hypothetical protein KatS3mg057_1135 [Herpetosiphonaceae bacterium]